jgi:hypothetical protein
LSDRQVIFSDASVQSNAKTFASGIRNVVYHCRMALKKTLLSAAELEEIRKRASRAIAPLRPATKLFGHGKRTSAGRTLPPYYLVYFLLVELLGFRYSGREEKVDWIIPVEFEGHFFTVEFRKLGLGIFSTESSKEGAFARLVAKAIHKGVNAATPFFNHLAAKAVQSSQLNVTNNSLWLFDRYKFLRDQFKEKAASAEARKDEVIKTELPREAPGIVGFLYIHPSHELMNQAEWLAIGAIDAFFSWTEHIFIHIGILTGKLTTAENVAALAVAKWEEKAKVALDLSDDATRKRYEEILEIRRQVRNYIAHGSFGKQGEAFQFHSSAGAVPVMLNEPATGGFSILEHVSFKEIDAISTIERFVEHLWSDPLAPAKLYIEDAVLPAILTYASDGTYARAMQSTEEMGEFVYHLSHQIDDAANMDW